MKFALVALLSVAFSAPAFATSVGEIAGNLGYSASPPGFSFRPQGPRPAPIRVSPRPRQPVRQR